MAEIIDIVMSESEQEGTESIVERWFKQPGDAVSQHEPIVEISTDKVSMEIAAPVSGILKEILKEANDYLAPGEVLGRIEVSEAGAPAQAPEAGQSDKPSRRRRERSAASGKEIRLSPLVRKMIETHGLDASKIIGSGRGGRISAEDVEKYLAAQSGDKGTGGEVPSRMVPHSSTRIRTANHMVDSLLKTAPHVTAVFDADLSVILSDRQKRKADFEKKGVKLTLTAYFVQATVAALQAVPEVNSRWHDDGLEIFEDYNIGIAAATDQGLLVPVLHKTQELSLFEIAQNLQDITGRARDGKMEKKDVRNGTFTITNHGMTGSLIATPIINQPQSAILGIGKLEKRVVVVEKDGVDETEIKPMAYITLTIDHRALDGFQANAFLTSFVEALQTV